MSSKKTGAPEEETTNKRSLGDCIVEGLKEHKVLIFVVVVLIAIAIYYAYKNKDKLGFGKMGGTEFTITKIRG